MYGKITVTEGHWPVWCLFRSLTLGLGLLHKRFCNTVGTVLNQWVSHWRKVFVDITIWLGACLLWQGIDQWGSGCISNLEVTERGQLLFLMAKLSRKIALHFKLRRCWPKRYKCLVAQNFRGFGRRRLKKTCLKPSVRSWKFVHGRKLFNQHLCFHNRIFPLLNSEKGLLRFNCVYKVVHLPAINIRNFESV